LLQKLGRDPEDLGRGECNKGVNSRDGQLPVSASKHAISSKKLIFAIAVHSPHDQWWETMLTGLRGANVT